MKNFKRFLKYALPYKFQGILSVFFNILYAVFTTLSYVILMPVLNVLFGETESQLTKPTFPGWQNLSKEYLSDYLNYGVTYTNNTYGVERTLLYVIIVVIAVFFFKNLFGYLGKVLISFLKNNVLKDLRDDLYTKLVDLPVFYFSEKKKGDVISRSTNDLGVINNSYLDTLIVYLREPLNIILTLYVMYKVSWELTLIMFGFIPVSGILISLISKKIKKHASAIFSKEGVFLSILEETLGGLSIIKAFGAEAFVVDRYEKETEEMREVSNKLAARNSLAGPISEFLGVASIASILWFGGKMVLIDQVLTGGTFIGFMASAYNILTPAKAISKANNSLKVGNSAAERVVEILNTINPLNHFNKEIDLPVLENEIRFDNVSFKYDDEYVLKDFTLTIPKGKTIAFVGESGSGKSTIANLLARFYDVNEGEITVDSVNIKDVSVKSLRSQMGIVAQDSMLFNDTIRNNIALGFGTKNEVLIKEASEQANAHEFISNFPRGYDTLVGDRGSLLSGGQRQRICIARALLKNPPIMIFDEATSALDTESEKTVQKALDKMMQNRTSIVIAHRLSTIRKADNIVVMGKGRILEQGTHEELLGKKGAYDKLVQLQSLA